MQRVETLAARISELEGTIRLMEEQRELEIRRRRRNLLMIGVAVSLVAHLGLMVYLNFIHRGRPAATGTRPVSFEMAVLPEAELTRLEQLRFEDLAPQTPLDLDRPDEPTLDLAPQVAAVSLEITADGASATLSGSGSGEGADALSGGGAGTSFFGVSSRGTRFAYIVDVSGSMGQERKIDVCMRELARSIEALPDYAYFYVVLFSSQPVQPPAQRGWTRARPETISRLIRWLNQVDPRGGTQPEPAFSQAFSVPARPDVIFFLTDGQIPAETPETVEALNSRGKRVVINAIAFGDPTSQELLKQIARASGGVYRFVPSEGW